MYENVSQIQGLLVLDQQKHKFKPDKISGCGPIISGIFKKGRLYIFVKGGF